MDYPAKLKNLYESVSDVIEVDDGGEQLFVSNYEVKRNLARPRLMVRVSPLCRKRVNI